MKSYNIDGDRIKICLTDEEIKSLFGSFDMIDYDSPRSRAILDSLICSALPAEPPKRACEKVLIEVMPEKSGCSIQVTRIYGKTKGYERKKKRREYILLFDSSEDMISYIKALSPRQAANAESSKLYRAGGRYALFTVTEDINGMGRPAEYARIISSKDMLAGKIAEHGEYICRGAIEKLYKAFNV